MIGNKYKSSSGKTGTLTLTKTEGSGYKWINCLALLDDEGRWVLSCRWRSNAFKKAHEDIIKLGFTLYE